jgi:outer membrane protein TolC
VLSDYKALIFKFESKNWIMESCMKNVYLLLMFVLVNNGLADNNQTVLTLDKAIHIALKESYSAKRLNLDLIRAEQRQVAAKGRFKTNADLRVNAPNWREMVSEIPVPGDLPVFNTTGSVRYQGILDINQPLPTDGVFTLRSMAYHRNVSTYLARFDQEERRSEMYTSVSLQFQQPLFTYNRLKTGYKIANLNYEQTFHRYKRNQMDIVYQVTQSFFALYRATRQKEIASENVLQQQDLYDLAQKKYNAGLIPEVQALEMEVDLAETKNQLLEAEGVLTRTEEAFKQYIGLKPEDQITVETDMAFEPMEVDLQRAIELGLKYRTEIREQEIGVELSKIDLREADARSEIRGDLTVFYDLTGISDPTLPYGSSVPDLWSSALTDMERRPNNRGVIFTLTVPLWDWGVNAAEVGAARAGVRNEKLDLAEQKKTIVRQVKDVVGQLREAENRLDVLLKNLNVAQRAFDISLERFDHGDITSQELALNRNRLTQAKTSYLSAYIDYRLAEADLRRKTMWDFKTNKSLVEQN